MRILATMHIGGPNSCLPLPIESTLTWGLCFSCLAVSGYHYNKSILLSSGWCYNIYRRTRILVRSLFGGLIGRRIYQYPLQDAALADHGDEATWIPLTTHSRSELERASPWERYLSLLRLFEKCYPEVLTPLSVPTKNGYSRERALSNMDSFEELKCHANASLIHVLRTDDICRRLASLAMRPYDPSKWPMIHQQQKREQYPHTTTTLLRQFPHNRLLQRMSIFWKYLLVLPSLEEVKSFYHLPTSPVTPVAVSRNKKHVNECNYPYRISLILPAYREKGSHLLKKLTKALELAQDPNEVEVVVVDAGGCSDLELLLPLTGNNNENIDTDNDDVNFKPSFGRVSIFSYKSGGGRGPCLNFGAHVATGRILTFCHSDTTMPEHWDLKIVNTLENSDDRRQRVNSCAFSFGVDTSPEGLSMPFESSSSSSETATYCPRGIRALEFFTNVRNYLFSLPYGDQVLSLHACVFHFIGGYPDQCLMEDYDLVSLLRRRAALFTPPYDSSSGDIAQERLAIISGAPAVCSPRRWQKHGVLYVTFMNYKFVNMYAGRRKTSPDDLFKLYYGSEAPKRTAVESPWEVELAKIMYEHSAK